MHLVFVDDSKQQSPTRSGVGPLVGMGALGIPADAALGAGRALDALCTTTGFPPGEEFKWSPPPGSWMRSGLVGATREAFWFSVVDILRSHDCYALFVAEDQGRSPATNAQVSAELDATCLLLERIAQRLKRDHQTALVLTDRPSGGTSEENAYLGDLYSLLSTGTDFVSHEEISIVAATQSRLVRLLQAADMITSCLTAYVAGESTYSPPVASRLLELLPAEYGRRGGASVKLHPDFCFLNLYHWLFGDEFYKHGNAGHPLPMAARPYNAGPDSY